MRIGLLLQALGTVAALANVNSLTELNSLRAANGIPAGIINNPSWSAGCAAHMNYLELNDYEGEWHTEVRGRPGYTDAGKQAAGSSVLSNASSVGSTRTGSRRRSTSRSCSRRSCRFRLGAGLQYTWPGYLRPEPRRYGALHLSRRRRRRGDEPVPVRARVRWGCRRGHAVGRVDHRSRGPVDVNVIDNHTPGAEGYLPPGGVLAPAAPLEDDSTYTAQVTFTSDEGAQATRRWSFSTGELGAATEQSIGEADPWGNDRRAVAERPHAADDADAAALGGGARATIAAQGNALGRTARVTLQRTDCRCRPTKGLQAHAVRAPLRVARAARAGHRVALGLLRGRHPVPRADIGSHAVLAFCGVLSPPAQARPDRPDAVCARGGRRRAAGAARRPDSPSALEITNGWAGAQRPHGQPVPDFTLPTRTERRSAQRPQGHPVVFAFIYSTCRDTCPAQVQTIRGALEDVDNPA